MRIVIAEDAAVLRDGLSFLLIDRGHEVVAAVWDADELRRVVASHRPDIAIVDIRMAPTYTDEGLRAATEVRQANPNLAVLIFSQYIEPRYATELLSAGCDGVGYLLKERVADVSDFMDALDRIASGGTVLDSEVVSQMLRTTRQGDALRSLRPREREVLALMAEGRSNAAIARQLSLTYGAIEKNIASIFVKLDLPPSDDDHRRVLAVLRYLQ